MIFGKYVHSDLDINSIQNSFKLVTKSGIKSLTELFENPSVDIDELKKRQLPSLLFTKLAKQDSQLLSNIHTQLNLFKENETFFENIKSLNEESIHQILWKSNTVFGNYANQSSSILETFHNWRTLFIPGSTLIAPVLAIIVPFAILQLMDKKPNVHDYLTIIQKTIRSAINIPSLFKSKHENDRIGFLFESLYIGMTISFFMSGLYNTFANALHLRNIGNELKEYASQIQILYNCLKSLNRTFEQIKTIHKYADLFEESNKILDELKILENKSGLGLFGTFYNNQNLFDNLYSFIGKIDVYYTISQLKNISFTYFVDYNKTNKFMLKLKDIYHPLLTNPVTNSFDSSNSLLTGPNRGGKSTYLKTIGLSVYLSQTIGIVFGKYCKLTPFHMFETALSPVDSLGRLSLFESEIEFAKSILQSTHKPTFILMDEIFHSTNANDGYEASKIFLSQLYEKQHILSIISTHYHKLIEDFEKNTTSLQAYCEKNEKGDVIYTYKIKNGVCTISSVLEILKEHNLIASN